ncbi:MAG: chlorophyll a-b binding domain-containing protein [Cyanobacteria bacterium]|nr:chlorophyll a-b binding domain-containing protein [Cyanobacteriota bacterium]MDW8200126.1 chlorophyll a/b-binding protein [Cyanobacteriota bacterium SKYGB_h_bin112]
MADETVHNQVTSEQTADQPTTTAPVTPSANPEEPAFGWNGYAERLNGRFAMVGFVLLLVLEWFTGQDFFTWLGLR